MKQPYCRIIGAGQGDTKGKTNPPCPVSTDRIAWLLLLLRLEPLNLPLLAINLKTGKNLPGWTTATFTPAEVAGSCSRIGAVGFRLGPDAGGVIAFDIDGPPAVAECSANGCAPMEAQIWQIRRDTDPDRLKVVWRIPEEMRDLLPLRISKFVTKPPSARVAKDGEKAS